MFMWWRGGAAILVAFGVLFASPLTAKLSLPAVEVQAGQDAPALARYIRYTKDIGPVEVPIEQMLDLTLQANATGVEHFGPPGQRTTLAVKIRNVSEAAGTWILTTGRGSLSYFRLYELTPEGFDLILDGSNPTVAQHNLRTYQAFSSELTLQPDQERTIVIDFKSDNSTYMPLKLETYGTFFQDRRTNIAMVSGVVLAIAVLVFINSMFFSITGHREFGWLALAQAFFAISTIHTEGYLTIFLLADNPLLSVAIEDGVKAAYAASMAQFARTFLKTSERFARLDKALLALIAAGFIVIALQFALSFFGPGFRGALHSIAWLVTGLVALFLPVVGVLAVRHIGWQHWPLVVGWGSLAGFIVYGAVASMGVFDWLPINWHWVGPVGLFEVLMVTLALGLNLRKVQADRQEADANYARSIGERLQISEQAARLAEEREFALGAINNQNALLHASGHDSRQVILALNSAINVLRRSDADGVHGDLTKMLQSSADYLSEIAATTMSGAAIVGSKANFIALSAFKGGTLIEPLLMMFKGPFSGKGLILQAEIDRQAMIISDRPLLMRALANLLSNSHHHTAAGGARVSLRIDQGRAVIEISDTGTGMSEAVAHQLMHGDLPRTHSNENGAGTGSGFRSARQIIEGLGGTLVILASDPSGTTVQVSLCCAYAEVRPCALDDLAGTLPDWRVLDFDRRTELKAASAANDGVDKSRIIAATYDDTSVTRERLSEAAALMLIKPVCIEMAQHPALQQASDQI